MSWCPEVGATLSDRYELQRRLGDGPTGVVFAALDRKLAEPCALKVLHPALFDGAHNATNLLRLQRARAFVHEGIAKLRDVVMDGQRVYVVTELLAGSPPLDVWIERQGPPSSSDVNAILSQLVAALEWIHQIGVHGNLKPANVLIDVREGDPKVTVTDPWTLAGRSDVPRGELPGVDEAWLAPEQRRLGWEESRAADVHGLGLLLGFMTAGRRVSGGLPLIAQGVVAPVALDNVFERATAVAPADRFASVRALFEAAEPAVMAASLPLVLGRREGSTRDPDETTDDALADAGLDQESVDALMRGGATSPAPPQELPAPSPDAPPAAPPGPPPTEDAPGQVPGAALAFSEPSDISFGFGGPEETIVDFGGRHGAADAGPGSTTLPPLSEVDAETGGAVDGDVAAPTDEAAQAPSPQPGELPSGALDPEETADDPSDATLVLGTGALMASVGETGAGETEDDAPMSDGGAEAPREAGGGGPPPDELDLTTRLDEAGAVAVLEASGAAAGEPTLMDVAATFEMPAATPPPGFAAEAAERKGDDVPRQAGEVEARVQGGEGADTSGGEPLATRTLDAEVLDAEVLDAEVLEAEALDADVLDAEVLDVDALDAEVLEVEVLDEPDVARVEALGATTQPAPTAPDVAGVADASVGPAGGTEPDAGGLLGAEDVVELGASALIPEGAADALAAGVEPSGQAEPLEVGDDSIVEAVELDEDSIVELGASALLEVGAEEAAIELGASALIETPSEGAPSPAAEAPGDAPMPAPPSGGRSGPRFKPGPGAGAARTGQISVAAIRAGEPLPGVGAGPDALALGLEDGLPAPDSGLLGDRMDSVLSVAPLGSALDAYDSMDVTTAARPRGTSERRLGATIPPGTASALGAATSGVSSSRPGGAAPRKTTTRSHELRKPVMLKRRRSPFVYVAVALMVLAAALLVFVLTRGGEPTPAPPQALAAGGLDAGHSPGAGERDAGGGVSDRMGHIVDAGGPTLPDVGEPNATAGGVAAAAAQVDAGAGVAVPDAGSRAPEDAGVSAAAGVEAGALHGADTSGGSADVAATSLDAGRTADAAAVASGSLDAATGQAGAQDAGPAVAGDAGAAVASADAGTKPSGPTAETFVPKDPKRYRCPGGMAKVRSRRRVTLADGTKVKDWDIFCIDKYEYPGQGRPPRVNIGLSEAKAACKARGRRLCTRSEWRKGCGGKYPYGRTYDPTRCNTVGESGMPKPLVTAGFLRRCRSGWGTYDMVGNAAEWTSDGRVNGGSAYKDGASATCFRSSRRMGGHPYVGFRCCADAIPK